MTERDIIQKEFINKGIAFYKTNTKGYLDLTMRTGKILITLSILKAMKYLNKKILIAYPDNKILNSYLEDQEKFNIQLKNVTYCNFSSLKKYVNQEFDWVVIDEPQCLSENELLYATNISDFSQYSLALSGTINSELKNTLEEDFKMQQIAKFTKEQAIEKNVVADYQLTIHLVDLDNKIKTKNKKGKLTSEKEKFDAYSWVINQNRGQNNMFLILARNRISQNSVAKNNKIKELLNSAKEDRVIVFTGLTKQAESLGIPFYHSKCKDDGALIEFNEKKYNHLALAASGKVGTNYKDLNSVILSNFTGNDGDNRQLLDRCANIDYKGKISDMHIICLNEPNEIKKIQNTLNELDKTKIKWV